jgi:hypothetical protein
MQQQQPTFSNPPFEIVECQRSDFKQLTGDDIIFFNVTLRTASYSLFTTVPFDSVVSYCTVHHPKVGRYYRSVRASVKGLGPKHSVMFNIMDEEGFDHLPYIHACINHFVDLDARHEQEEELRKNPPPAKQLKERVESLEQHFPAMRSAAIRNEQFTDNLMDHINNEVVKHYPEIFNADPKLIEEFHGKLIHWVRTIGTDLDSLAHRAGQ